MAGREIETCATCPAFNPLIGEGRAGICRARPPVVFQEPDYFRGSTRSMLFGAYPAVGTYPLVRSADYCMEHPDNRAIFMHGGPVVVPEPPVDDDLTREDVVERVLGVKEGEPGPGRPAPPVSGSPAAPPPPPSTPGL